MREMRRHPTWFPVLGALLVAVALATSGIGAVMFGPHAYDSSGMLRAAADGNLTATVNGAGLTIRGTPVNGVTVRVHVPSISGTTPTLDLKIQHSDDGATWTDLATFPQINTTTGVGEYRRRVATPKRDVRYAATVAGTTPNFGAVQIGFETGGEQAAW